MTDVNRNGLSRPIPEAIKRDVRRACNFGCVICARTFVHYDHFDPEFKDATEHKAAGIVLLCPTHHTDRGNGILSDETVRRHREQPKTRNLGYSRGEFDFGIEHPEIHFAGNILKQCRTPLSVEGQPLIRIEGPEELGAPFRVSATFCDREGTTTLEIVENEWRATTEAWDVEMSGARIRIWEKRGSYALVLRILAGKGIAIERLKMQVHGVEFEGDEKRLQVGGPDGPTFAGNFLDMPGGIGMAFKTDGSGAIGIGG